MPSDSSSQRKLFTNHPIWEEDDVRNGVIATVVLPEGVEKPLDYIVPNELVVEVEPGRRVHVPLGKSNRPRLAYCVAVRHGEIPQHPLKSVVGVEDEKPLLSERMLELTGWMADRWMARRGDVLEAVLPAGVRLRRRVKRVPVLVVTGEQGNRRPTVNQKKILDAAIQPTPLDVLLKETGVSRSVVNRLLRTGMIIESGSIERDSESDSPESDSVKHNVGGDELPVLSVAQEKALQAILYPLQHGTHETIVLFGVTGSGKTEVYLQAVTETIARGQQAIVLVPEISLTPQTCDRFRSRFGKVAVLHSHLTPAERHDHWREIAAGRVSVIVGARSAIFAPAPRLGLIVIDEEHENTFKQATSPRYHARDVAEWIAQKEGVPLVLGSATPSLETFARCLSGDWKMCRMPERVGGSELPAVVTVDLRDRKSRSKGAISPRLAAGIQWALNSGGQVMLLLNRRGFATHLQCKSCGHAMHCPQCDLGLTLHQPGSRGICHGCGLVTGVPESCPSCGVRDIVHRGTGTQRLEDQVRSQFRGIRVARMDTDTMRTRGSHEKTLTAFRKHEIDLLVGTQMIAKGLDFPNVMLVGVINADAALHLADFRASERTCQLVTQVAGRSGRGPRGGRVVVQTSTPEHPAIRAAAAHDYEAFVRSELPIRKALLYPPFGSVIRIVVRSAVDEAAANWAKHLVERLSKSSQGDESIRILGPAPAPISRIRDRYRWHLQIHGPSSELLRNLVGQSMAGLKTPQEVVWVVDVDPVEML